MLGLIGKIGLHDDQAVSARIAGAAIGLPNKLIDRKAKAFALFASQHCQRDDFGVRRYDLAGAVSASIVINDDLVLARVVLKNTPDPPKKHSDGRAFVVCRNADIKQGNS
jgi:hypothetical protein